MEENWEQPQLEGDEHQEVLEEDEEEDDILDMGDDDDEANAREGLLMRFCPHDSSMLYPQVSDIFDYHLESFPDCSRSHQLI